MSQAALAEVSEEAIEKPAESRPKPRPRTDQRQTPRYHVILWNDNDHTFGFVIRMMRQLFGHPREMGIRIAWEVHNTGRAITLTTTKEHAELKRDQIHAYGSDREVADCQGCMSCTIEPADA